MSAHSKYVGLTLKELAERVPTGNMVVAHRVYHGRAQDLNKLSVIVNDKDEVIYAAVGTLQTVKER